MPAPSAYRCLQYPTSSTCPRSGPGSTSASSSSRHWAHELSLQSEGGSISKQKSEHGGGLGGGRGGGADGGHRMHTPHVSAQKPSLSVLASRAAHFCVLTLSCSHVVPGGCRSTLARG